MTQQSKRISDGIWNLALSEDSVRTARPNLSTTYLFVSIKIRYRNDFSIEASSREMQACVLSTIGFNHLIGIESFQTQRRLQMAINTYVEKAVYAFVGET